jgi:hypothetical protein
VRPEGVGKFKKLPHRVSNPRPSSLLRSALTTTLLLPHYIEKIASDDRRRMETPQYSSLFGVNGVESSGFGPKDCTLS